MAEIVNLRRARKAKVRADAERQAAENRSSYGRTKAERNAAAAAEKLSGRLLDAHRREPPGDGE